MLVLNRRVNETIIIQLPNGEEIRVTLLESRRGSSRLGFAAPQSVNIVREELVNGKPS